jgi:hypothetical protein
VSNEWWNNFQWRWRIFIRWTSKRKAKSAAERLGKIRRWYARLK